ncbi:MAG: hypothetical protein IID32_06330, partial [Planctomycetes bacterium]|nr:hypothetical protein [Planctomycetota bacterium]
MSEINKPLGSGQVWPGYWRSMWRQFRRNRRSMAGLWFVVLMGMVTIFSPLLATNQPIVCRYEGKWYFPAIVEIFQKRGSGTHWMTKAKPFNLPQFEAKKELGSDDFAIWPLIAYHENEQTLEYFARPSWEHWLGTDELGRDIAARMIHGTSIAFAVGFLSMGIAAVIGILVGAVAGYCGGWVDIVISRIIEVVICFPVFFLILAMMVWL